MEGATAGEAGTSDYWARFDELGPKMEEGFSFAVEEEIFTYQLVSLTQERRDGDYEILMTELFESKLKDGTPTKEWFLEKAGPRLSEAEIDEFLLSYPSTVVGVRGNPATWMTGDHLPPVKFVPSDFDEKTQETSARQMGRQVSLDLSQPFEEAVIAIHTSERHDLQGNYVKPAGLDPVLTRQAQPGLNLNDVDNANDVQVICGPEPTACPSSLPFINSFTATPENGQIKLSWSISNFSPSLCSWGRVRIKRYNPNGTTSNWLIYADDGNLLFDNTGGENVTYTYEISAYIAYKSASSTAYNNWVTCFATNNFQQTTAVFPGAGAPVTSYAGTNQASSSIRYDWVAPAGTPVTEYRIRRATNSGFTTLATGIPAFNSTYFWSPGPSSFSGQLVETQIQYRAGGPWTGAYYDKTYASYRNSGQPFKYYGIRMDDVTAFEFNESPLYGAPEIRLTALQASASESPIVLTETYLPMSGCTETQIVCYGSFGCFPTTVNSGYYYPTDAPDGFTILSSWNSDLAGTAIRVKTLETDIGVPVITEQTNTSSNETKLSAKFGFKLFKVVGVDLGVESTWKDTETTTIRYPNDDLPISDNIIYYHEFPTNVIGTQLFGDISFSDRCTNLSSNL